MTNNDNTDAHDELLAEIFEHASPRPQPSAEAQEQAFAALHSEWQELAVRRQTRRRVVSWSLAATVVIAAVLGFRNFGTSDAPSFEAVAELVRVSGNEISANDQPVTASTQVGAPMSLFAGDILETGDNSRVALTWSVGGSLRLDQNTHIEIVSAEVVRLIDGAVYFDSQQFGQPVNPDMKLSVETSYGRVTHVGTQFLLRMGSNSLAISVREGKVHVDMPKVKVDVRSGSTMTFSSNGEWSSGSVSAHDPRWNWATTIAPEVQVDGRSVAEILEWVGRESGRRVDYRSVKARQSAQDSRAYGIGNLNPAQALNTIPTLTDLQTDDHSTDDRIIVE